MLMALRISTAIHLNADFDGDALRSERYTRHVHDDGCPAVRSRHDLRLDGTMILFRYAGM
jgi:hypothetical protein